MAKTKRTFVCSSCGHEQPSFSGICPECKEPGTMKQEEAKAEIAGRTSIAGNFPAADFVYLDAITSQDVQRQTTGIEELDRVLGGGLVEGSYLSLAGEPGAGKTTIASEVLLNLSRSGRNVAYVSGEESSSQLKMRFQRLGASDDDKIKLSTEQSVERISQAVSKNNFSLLVIDSIQTIFSENISSGPGSVAQVQECTHRLMQAAKSTGTSILLIGQVIKSGNMAGPKALEHLVDVTLSFEGDNEDYRILRTNKNRFGSADEIGVFEMTAKGLKGIADPSTLFIEDDELLPGSALTAVIQGSRPVLCEIQVLAAHSNLPQPARVVRGFNKERLQMLLAVMQQRAGFNLGSLDVYVNISGGLKIDDPGTDLALCLALASAAYDSSPKERYCTFGELSLLGQTRSASQEARRQKEAERLGYVPLSASKKSLDAILRDALNEPGEGALLLNS